MFIGLTCVKTDKMRAIRIANIVDFSESDYGVTVFLDASVYAGTSYFVVRETLEEIMTKLKDIQYE